MTKLLKHSSSTLDNRICALSAFIKRHKTLFAFIGAVLTTEAFYLNLGVSNLPKDISSYALFSIPLYRLIIYFIYSIKSYNMYSLFLFFAIFYFYNRREPFKAARGEKISVFLFSQFAVFMLMLCDSYRSVSSWDLVFGGKCAFAVALAKIFGIGILLYSALTCILNYIHSSAFSLTHVEQAGKGVSRKKYFIKYLLIIFICWLPYIILLYPGTVSHDATDEIAQLYGMKDISWSQRSIVLIDPDVIINNHHPVFYTCILGLFSWLGERIGSYETAFFIYTIIQCAMLAAVFSCTVVFTREHHAKKGFVVFEVLFFALNPLFPDYACTMSKDIPFTIATLFTMLSVYKILENKHNKPASYAILFLECLLMMLLRNNGLYMLAFLLIVTVISLIRTDKKKLAKLATTLIIAILVFQVVFIQVICPYFKITPGSKREMLSVPFQQTARYVKEYPDDISAEDEEAILKVLQFDSLEKMAKAYNPKSADPVKNRYNKYTTSADLFHYFQVWLKQLKTHPAPYFEAYLNLYYPWFSFSPVNAFTVYSSQNRSSVSINKVLSGWNLEAGTRSGRRLVTTATEAFKANPVLSVFVEMGSYTWLYLFLLVYGLSNRKKKALIVNTPIFANYLICFLGPISYTRYAIPMIAASVFSLFVTFTEESDINQEKIKEVKR